MTNPFRKSLSDYGSAQVIEEPSSTSQLHYELSTAQPCSDANRPLLPHQPSNPFPAPQDHESEAMSGPTSQHVLSRTDDSNIDLEANHKRTPTITVSEALEAYKTSSTTTTGTTTPVRKTSDLKPTPITRVQSMPSRDSVWPSRQELEEKAKLNKQARRKAWNCLGGLPRRQRLAVKILIALILIAAAVGIGVGISRAVGGTTYSTKPGQMMPIDGGG